jgi:ubiquinone/menaquinone biosynthesis C-methylase UbiE
MEGTDHAQASDAAQAKLWNGPAGHAWVESQQLLDALFAPVEVVLTQAVAARSARRVLDVGCGTGATTLAIARVVGAGGACIGADVSEPMIALARARAERESAPPSFVRADVQSYAFEPAVFDMIVSRFGVMFFDDSVAAFRNLRRASAQGGELCCVAWRGPEENPFMVTAERAAAPLMPDLPARRTDGPGQFAFADPEHVRRMLAESGWSEIDIEPYDFTCRMSESSLEQYVTRHGPVGLALHALDGPTRTRVIEALRAAFAPFVHGGEARFTAACWRVSARAR